MKTKIKQTNQETLFETVIKIKEQVEKDMRQQDYAHKVFMNELDYQMKMLKHALNDFIRENK